MPNLMTHLKKVSEQKPQATYYNVDMLKYQVRRTKPQISIDHRHKDTPVVIFDFMIE